MMLNYKQINNRIAKYPVEEVIIYKYVSLSKKPTSYEIFQEVNGEPVKRICPITHSQVEYYTDKGHSIKNHTLN